VSVFTWCVSAVFALVGLPTARAELEKSIHHMGNELMRQMGPLVVGPTRTLSINGQRLFVASKTTTLPPEQVLSLFDRNCREGTAKIRQDLEALPAGQTPLPPELRDPSRWLSVRADAEDGEPREVACVVPAASAKSLQGLMNRFSAFSASGNVSDIGDVRYVVVRRAKDAHTTHVFAVWSEGTFSIPAMFPAAGDAPGTDPEDAPRPHNAVRVLSAELTGHPYALRMYDTTDAADGVLRDYASAIVGRGWTSTQLPEDDVLNEGARAFVKGSSVLLVTVSETPRGKSGITVLELGSTGFVQAEVRDQP
jgi:hypothetical protein